jgi:AcrR family transcriptional regulator
MVLRKRATRTGTLRADMTPPPKRTPSSVLEDIGVQRRSPFGENPEVGARGARTQQRILRAALEVFGRDGYQGCRVERITELAGCSRPSFYQYFSSKEDLFRQLAGEVARELFEGTERMGMVTPDDAGWQALRDWLGAHVDLYQAYWPVFVAFTAAEGSDELVASGAARVGRRHGRMLAAHIDPRAFKGASPEVVTGILLNAVNRANRYRQLLLLHAPGRAPERERLLDSLTEVLHRAMFGKAGGGRVPHRPFRLPTAPAAPVVPGTADATTRRLGPTGRHTRARLVDAGATVFAAKGFHETRIDDIVAAAGTSHGTFYRYFESKDQVFRVVTGRSGRRIFGALATLPDLTAAFGTPTFSRRLRAWLDAYAVTYAEEGPIFRLWVEALAGDPELTDVTVQTMDVIRIALARFLEPRAFGDVEMDGFLLLAILDLTRWDRGAVAPADPASLDAVMAIIRRGFLGMDVRLG